MAEFPLTLPSGSKGTYKGQAKDGKPFGWGVFKYLNDNNTYEGEYAENGKMTGIHKFLINGEFKSFQEF